MNNTEKNPAVGCALERRVRLSWRTTTKSGDGISVIRVGACCGYWPCLKAPYVQLSLGTRILDLWYGTASQSKTTVPNMEFWGCGAKDDK